MRSVADAHREEDARAMAAMSADERVALAFRLGDEDLEIYRRAWGVSREVALRRVRMARQAGRVPCRCLEEAE